MRAKSFGKIAVPTPGTLVRLTADTTLRVARLRLAVVIGETGRVFLGVSGMNKANGTGVIKEFWPTGAGGGVADQIITTGNEALRGFQRSKAHGASVWGVVRDLIRGLHRGTLRVSRKRERVS